jgi:CrcB protein
VSVLLQFAFVAVGSALGGLARWGVGVLFRKRFGSAFPWGTLFINLTGSMFLGWLFAGLSARLADFDESWLRPEHLKLGLAVGFTGAYTTFSTFEMETHDLFKKGDSVLAILYVLGSAAGGLLAVCAGDWLAQASWGALPACPN